MGQSELVIFPLASDSDLLSLPGGGGGGGGGGSVSATEIEVDFGSSPRFDAEFTVSDASVTSSSSVIASESGKAAAGRSAGDSAWDSIACAALPGSGQFTLYCTAHPGPVVGKRKIQYLVV